MPHDPSVLPEDLPVPVDDGAAAHLAGSAVPDLRLPATTGVDVNLGERCGHRPVVVFAYPRTGRPGVEPLVPDWDQIPGARGCTPEACGFRDLAIEFTRAGAELFGLATQDTEYQQEAVARLGLGYPLLSDDRLAFTGALKLPTMTVAGMVLLRRCTLILARGRVRDVLYPVFPPDKAAAEALRVLRGGGF